MEDEIDDPAGRHALSEAALLAKVNVKEWVRCVLREVALQSLQRDMRLDDSRGTIELKVGAAERARGLCNRVGQEWVEQIRSAGHFEAGEWIMDVLEAESGNFFHCPAGRPGAPHLTATSNSSRRVAATFRKSSSSTGVSRLNNAGSGGVSDVLSGGPSVENAIKLVDDLAAQNGTDWPFEWQVIQDRCDDIQFRLHNSKRKRPDLADSPHTRVEDSVNQYQLLPLEAQLVQADECILRRKRKSRYKNQQSANPPQFVAAEGDNTAVDLEAEGPVPRPPSTVSHQVWSKADRALSEGEEKKLGEIYIHSDETTSPAFSTLLGSLTDAGRFHHSLKHGDDGVRASAVEMTAPVNVGSRTVRQMKWQKRISINERLGNHRLVSQDTRGCGSASRIQRTMDGNERYWFDFDLGHCLLDAEEVEGGLMRRKLFFFDSLEASLLDEDRDSMPTSST